MAHSEGKWQSLSASCMCGEIVVKLDIPSNALPLRYHFCHCNICRWTSGHLAHGAIILPTEQRDQIVKGNASAYDSGRFRRYFCGICGTLVYTTRNDETGVLCLNPGAFDGDVELYKFTSHIHVDSTKDGGMSSWLTHVPTWRFDDEPHEGMPVELFQEPHAQVSSPEEGDDIIDCSCHCGGIQFHITRPTEESTNFSATLCQPYAAECGVSIKDNPQDMKYWVAKDGKRYLASICNCTSCRKQSGYDFQPWAFVPQTNIRATDGSPYNFQQGSIKTYRSSEGVRRAFCGVCGANAFWMSSFRKNLIDVSVGLMRSRAGARAQDWLVWCTRRLSFIEEAKDQRLAHQLQRGMTVWAKKHGIELLPPAAS